MTSQPRMEITEDTLRCSRATQVLMETPEAVNLTKFHPTVQQQTNISPCFHSGRSHSIANNQT